MPNHETKQLASYRTLANSGRLAIINLQLMPAKLKRGWWADPALSLERINKGTGLIVEIGDRPAWFNLRVWHGPPPAVEGPRASALSLPPPLVCAAELLDDKGWAQLTRVRKKADRAGGEQSGLRKGVYRYTALTAPDAVEIYCEFVSRRDGLKVPKNALAEIPRIPLPESGPELDEEQVLSALLAGFIHDLRAAAGGKELDEARAVEGIRRYLEAGQAMDCSPLELRDYFDISSPSLPRLAGCSKQQEQALAKLYTRESADFFA